jgi:uncharacterized protein YcfL
MKKSLLCLSTLMLVLLSGCSSNSGKKSADRITWSESGITMSGQEAKANSLATAVNIVEEGIVLLKNDN